MSKTPSQVTAIGFFILSATVLMVAMLIAFGGGSWLRSTATYTMRFNSSVKGLTNGSPVMFRGVNIGQVTAIRLQTPGAQPAVEAKSLQPDKPVHFPVLVTVELAPEKLGFPNGIWYNIFRRRNFSHTSKDDLHEYLADMALKQGLRAKLQTVSLLTGQLSIELAFDPVGAEQDDLEKVQAELNQGIFPTRLGFLDQVSSRIGDRNFRTQMESIQKLIAQLSDFIDSGKSKQLVEDIAVIAGNLRTTTDTLKGQVPALLERTQSTLADAQGLIGHADAQLTPLLTHADQLATRLTRVSDVARLLLTSLNTITEDARPKLYELLTSANQALTEAQHTISETNATLQDAHSAIAPDSQLRTKLENTLDDAQTTLASLKTLLDNLNRNPQILLLGE